MMADEEFAIGLEMLHAHGHRLPRDARIGLLSNVASVDRQLAPAWQVVDQVLPGQISALFTPQHGWWSDAQANMVETEHGWHRQLDVPLYSLYSETRRPTDEMLSGIDCLVVDLQDVGTRVYTYVWTMLECMHACSAANVAMTVLDRPNPLGGRVIEGPLLGENYTSFVGGASIPMRHGLTIGELARLFQIEFQIDLDLEVVPLRGWETVSPFDLLGRNWIPPSPNLPTLNSVRMYPGQVLLEGCNLSEGRGTTIPFEVIGAPFIDPDQLTASLNEILDGSVRTLPTVFCPTFDKWQGEFCGGVSFHILDPVAFRSFPTTLWALHRIQQMKPESFRWIDPPYEYETEKPPIDILYGGNELREQLGQVDPQLLARAPNSDQWRERTDQSLLYATASERFLG